MSTVHFSCFRTLLERLTAGCVPVMSWAGWDFSTARGQIFFLNNKKWSGNKYKKNIKLVTNTNSCPLFA